MAARRKIRARNDARANVCAFYPHRTPATDSHHPQNRPPDRPRAAGCRSVGSTDSPGLRSDTRSECRRSSSLVLTTTVHRPYGQFKSVGGRSNDPARVVPGVRRVGETGACASRRNTRGRGDVASRSAALRSGRHPAPASPSPASVAHATLRPHPPLPVPTTLPAAIRAGRRQRRSNRVAAARALPNTVRMAFRRRVCFTAACVPNAGVQSHPLTVQCGTTCARGGGP